MSSQIDLQGLVDSPASTQSDSIQDVHPIIHAHQEMPHLHTSKVQGAPQQNGMHGSDHPCGPVLQTGLSSITYVQKANGKLCLCLDPHDLNEAICTVITTRHPL